MNHIELFSGIGGFRRAMDLIQKDFNVPFYTKGFSEIDDKAKTTYLTNYPDAINELDMGDIVVFNEKHDDLLLDMRIDILTGGFPCQSFSMMGKQKGFEDERGLLFFQIYHILKLKSEQGQPVRYVLLENVKNLKTHDKGRTFRTIKKYLESIGYKVFCDVFNAVDYKQAQTRNRVFIFATTEDISNIEYTSKNISEIFHKNYHSNWSVYSQGNVLSVLEKNVDEKYYLSTRIKPTILSDGTGGYTARSEINKLIARPLTASMHKMHRACQDNYYSDEFILSEEPLEYLKKTFTKEELAQQRIRKLTPEEAFNLQGFPKFFATEARKKNIANGALYKQAGNAVSVNTVYAILYYLFVHLNLK